MTPLPTTRVARSRAKHLLAGALAAGALLVVTTPAYAQPNQPADPGVRCAAKVGPGQYAFYLPGEKATDVNGNRWVCGPDGQWFRDYSALVVVRQQSVRSPLPQLAF
jgi:hypothetical protein